MARPGTPYNPEDMESEETSSACEFFETEGEAYERIRAEVEREARERATQASSTPPQGESFDPTAYMPPQPQARPADYPPPQGSPVIPTTSSSKPGKKGMPTSTKVAVALSAVLLGFATGVIPAIIAGLIWAIQAAFAIAFVALIAYIVYRLTRTDEET